MAKKRAGGLGHRKGATWVGFVPKVPVVVPDATVGSN